MSRGQHRWIYCDALDCGEEWTGQRGSDSYAEIRRDARQHGWIYAPSHRAEGADLCPEHADQA